MGANTTDREAGCKSIDHRSGRAGEHEDVDAPARPVARRPGDASRVADDDAEMDRMGSERETGPYNAAAVRGPHGIWNEKVLPVTTWESAVHRIVLPESLQEALHLESPVIRWATTKREKVIGQHSQPIEVQRRQHLDRFLASWEWAGVQPGKTDTWRIFFRQGYRWSLVGIGRDRNGSLNLVTAYSPSDQAFLWNMIQRGTYVSRKEYERRLEEMK